MIDDIHQYSEASNVKHDNANKRETIIDGISELSDNSDITQIINALNRNCKSCVVNCDKSCLTRSITEAENITHSLNQSARYQVPQVRLYNLMLHPLLG